MDHKIKVLFLDIDNTLLDFDVGAAWAMNLCFEKAGLKYRPEMFAVFKEENNKIWRPGLFGCKVHGLRGWQFRFLK